ncbi:hypothetical protein F506_08465 [Herbaspirillum hiltneri N3]|uniref:DUF1868 domain-containing protein n=1 Tax=Herbaspirillum hiltneri N3 TaxID=1262470 RepID=A0ABM5UZH5_9BURK|nr:DUF1868 domain-containing protein [Herbaspirillum hiltneri]AKZ62703.1 hypothetical protein F506_08465 [Herbaspirillum hiltneri N3]
MKKRSFIKLAGMGAMGALGASGHVPLLAAEGQQAPLKKFEENGVVRPFGGNTVVFHTDKSSPLFLSMLRVQVELQRHFGDSITCLPPDSYHMTLFDMANQQDRKPGLWPSGVPLDASVEDCTKKLAALLKSEPISFPGKVYMKIDPNRPLSLPKEHKPGSQPAFIIPLLPYSSADTEMLRAFRNKLSGLSGIRTPSHDTYVFHTSMGYRIKPMSAETYASFETYYKKWINEMTQAAGKISFDCPDFCSFIDMYQFTPVVALK